MGQDPTCQLRQINIAMTLDQQIDPGIRCEPPLSPEWHHMIWCWFRKCDDRSRLRPPILVAPDDAWDEAA
jgi:hypothetical protein